MAPIMAVVLTPPIADTKTSRPKEPCISLRTSWKKDIRLRGPFDSSRTSVAANDQTSHARQHSTTPWAAFQLYAARWSGDQQNQQRQNRSDDQGQQKCPRESHSALAAAKPNQNRKQQIHDKKRE